MARSTQLSQSAAVFLCAFLAYQLPLPLITTSRYPDFWVLGADNFRVSLEHPGTHPAANYQIAKHPGFVAVAIPLHRLAKILFTPFSEPFRENAALTFPSALFGALNASLAYLLFCMCGFRGFAAVATTTMYAALASVWMFASFPETYACTTLLTTAFLWFYLQDPLLHRWKRLAAVNAFACLVTPQQVLLATIPVVGLRRFHWQYLQRLVAYLSVVGGCLLLYWLWLASLGRARLVVNETRWAQADNLTQWQTYQTVLFTNLSAAMIVPGLDAPKLNTILQSFTTNFTAWPVLLLVGVYGILGISRGRPLPTDDPTSPLTGQRVELTAFLLVSVLFYTWWDPKEAFLFSAPLQLPLWLLLHQGWVDRQDSRVWRTCMALAALIVVVSTAYLSWRLRSPTPLFFK